MGSPFLFLFLSYVVWEGKVTIFMKVSWMKSSKDKDSFNLIKNMGLKVVEIENLEETDKKLKDLIEEEYNTIFITNEVAGFSEDIMKRYYKSKDVRIVIMPDNKL